MSKDQKLTEQPKLETDEMKALREQSERLERENQELKKKLEAAQPKEIKRRDNGKLPKELVEKAENMIAGLKAKYKNTTGIKHSLDESGRYAYDVWEKAALENPKTGEAQLDMSIGNEPSIEKYFRRHLFGV